VTGNGVVLVVTGGGAASPFGSMVHAGGYRVSALVTNGSAALDAVGRDRSDLALIEIDRVLGGAMDGLAVARQLRERNGVVAVLVASADPNLAERAALVEPLAYLVKPVQPAQLLATLRHVTARTRRPKRRTHESSSRSASEWRGSTSLTPSELDVVRRLLDNGRVASIADSLGVSPYTVRNHLRAVYRKLNVHSQVELIRMLTAKDEDEPAASLVS